MPELSIKQCGKIYSPEVVRRVAEKNMLINVVFRKKLAYYACILIGCTCILRGYG